MRIAVLSGKGGAGKTLVSTNLAATFAQLGCRVLYADCDVEEPNGHLFLKPTIKETEPVFSKLPRFDAETCTGCRACTSFCAFNALAFVGKSPLLFGEVCHSCGGCMMVCPSGAITEENEQVGTVETGYAQLQGDAELQTVTGRMALGRASGVPVVHRVLDCAKAVEAEAGDNGVVVVDCPPGCACLTMESIRTADLCLLVAEPTVFSVHNFAMVHELTKLMEKPFAAVLNKCPANDSGAVIATPEANPAEAYCAMNNVQVCARLPFSRQLGAAVSDGNLAIDADGNVAALFGALADGFRKKKVGR